MAEAKTRLGKVPCKHCGEPTQVRQNAAGTLSMACDECGWSGYAKKGERCHAEILAQLPKPPSEPAKLPESEQKTPPVKKPASVFNMGAL